ncbi:patatin-like phospholipase family protein [Fodinisporobacter ferrooxydans]|uniref:Patatin-like phospholipase family protein n=1 Tax=Fodinisporobacter ferrooxydans TaxID=2901836 RepID=A0ABY4CF67_9BACL|nr:patatin-like phospholipase family protein [Alicyclobacillaceae bacterium MYW30-H2]
MARIGLALGGGGIVGSAHIGVLSALEEAGIQIDCIAGCSAGAIVAALYAYGYSPKEMMQIVPKISKRYLDYDSSTFLKKLINRNTQVLGLVKGKKLRNLIAELTNGAKIADVKMPIALLGVDLKQARQVIFTAQSLANCREEDTISDIALADAVQASFSIPVLFKPVIYKERVLVDGGLMNNCPIATAKSMGADKVIAVDLIFAEPTSKPFSSLLSILMRTISINLFVQEKQLMRDADLVLRPELHSIGLLDFTKMQTCMEAGYECARQQMKEIKEIIAN